MMRPGNGHDDTDFSRCLEQAATGSQEGLRIVRNLSSDPVQRQKELSHAGRVLREAGLNAPDVCFFLVVRPLLRLAGDRCLSDPRLRRTSEVDAEYRDIADQITVAVFRECGEHEIADLYVNDREEFDRRFESGRCTIFGNL